MFKKAFGIHADASSTDIANAISKIMDDTSLFDDYSLFDKPALSGALTRLALSDQIYWLPLLYQSLKNSKKVTCVDSTYGILSVQLANYFNHVTSYHLNNESLSISRSLITKQKLKNVECHLIDKCDDAGQSDLFVTKNSLTNIKQVEFCNLLDKLNPECKLFILENNPGLFARLFPWLKTLFGDCKINYRSLKKYYKKNNIKVNSFFSIGSTNILNQPVPEFYRSDFNIGDDCPRRLKSYIGRYVRKAQMAFGITDGFAITSNGYNTVSLDEESKIKINYPDRMIMGNGNTSILIAEHNGKKVIIRFSTNPSKSLWRIKNNIHALSYMSSTGLKNHIPFLEEYKLGSSFPFSIETACDGCNLDDITNKLLREKYIVNSYRFYYAEQKKRLVEQRLNDNDFEEIVSGRLVRLRKYLKNDDLVILDDVLEKLKNLMFGMEHFISFSHGDYKTGNILYDTENDRFYFIDWDMFMEKSFILVDIIVLYIYKKSEEESVHLQVAFKDILDNYQSIAGLSECIKYVERDLGLTKAHIVSYMIIAWLYSLDLRVATAAYNNKLAYENLITKAFSYIIQELDAA